MDAFLTKLRRSRWLKDQVGRQGALIVAIPVTCLFASLLAFAWLEFNTKAAQKQVRQSERVLLQANRLLATVVDAETAIQGYGLTGRPEFLAPYKAANSVLPDSLKKLDLLVENNPTRRQPLKKIEESAQQRMNLSGKTLEAIERLGSQTRRSPELTALLVESKLKMDALREQIAEFVASEDLLQRQLNEQITYWQRSASAVQWAAMLASLLGGCASWHLFQRLEREVGAREAGLQESKARIQAVVDSAADGIITLSELGNIESFNPQAERIFGYKVAQIKGANLRRLIAEPVRQDTTGDPLSYFLGTASAKLCSCRRETVGRRATGAKFPMELAVSEMRAGDQVLFIAICRDITERRKADETVRNQAQLLDLANDSILVLDINGTISYWNQGARRLYGWKKKEALGKNAHALLQTLFPHPVEKIKQVLLREGHWEGELVHSKRDGTKVNVASSWTLQRDEEGQPVAILEINNDITQRQQAQKALRESQKMLQLVMDSIPQFIFWKDGNSVYLGCNNNMAWLLGLNSPADIIGLTDFDLPVSREQVYRTREFDRQVMETNTPIYHVVERFSLQEPESKLICADANRVPLTDAAGKVVGILCTFDDITDRIRAEAALAESEQRFRATFEQAAVGIAEKTLDGQFLRVNQKLCEILGYTREELLGRMFQELTHPDDLQANLGLLRKLQAGEMETYSLEKRYIRKDGLPVWVNLTVSLLRHPEGNQSLMGVVEDITHRVEAQEALQARAEELARTTAILAKTTAVLRKRNQELDQFAYVVSHDLKAPLRAISNLSSWIEEDLGDALTGETQHQMNLLRGRVQRMEALINGLLQYSRVGRVQNAVETVDVGQLLADVIDSIAPPPSFTVDVAPAMPALETQRLPLQQVFANLIGNAIKHNRSGSGCVKISVREDGDFYEFAVADDGPGIAPEYHEKVFAIFQTLEARDIVENTGIGLALVKKIVESQGGTIHLESREGQGAIFRFTWQKKQAQHY